MGFLRGTDYHLKQILARAVRCKLVKRTKKKRLFAILWFDGFDWWTRMGVKWPAWCILRPWKPPKEVFSLGFTMKTVLKLIPLDRSLREKNNYRKKGRNTFRVKSLFSLCFFFGSFSHSWPAQLVSRCCGSVCRAFGISPSDAGTWRNWGGQWGAVAACRCCWFSSSTLEGYQLSPGPLGT